MFSDKDHFLHRTRITRSRILCVPSLFAALVLLLKEGVFLFPKKSILPYPFFVFLGLTGKNK